MKDEKEFILDEEFSFEWGRGRGTMYSTCTKPEPNVLFFQTEERSKNWEITSKMDFSSIGMVNTRVFVNEGLKTQKFYQREGIEIDTSDATLAPGVEVVKLDNEPEEDSPFSSDNDAANQDELFEENDETEEFFDDDFFNEE